MATAAGTTLTIVVAEGGQLLAELEGASGAVGAFTVDPVAIRLGKVSGQSGAGQPGLLGTWGLHWWAAAR